tara:strand:- start:32127 stop:32825 length:699 start_codon:yes stop_codon:yes gene_type:complete
MNVKDELERLTENIYIPTVFYVPKSVLPDLSEESIKELDGIGLIHTLLIFNLEKQLKSLAKDVSSMNIFEKEAILKTNYIQLIEIENQLTKESFLHVLNEYLQAARGYNHIYSWMLNHIDEDIPSITANFKSFFRYQAAVLKQHTLEVKNKFLHYNEQIDTSNNLDKIIEKGKEVIKLNSDFNKVIDETNIPATEPSKTTEKKKVTLQLPSEDQVDRELLASVFHVDFSNIK